MDQSSDTMLTASSSPIQPTFAPPPDSCKIKGTTLLLKVTQHEALLVSTSQDLTNMIEKSAGHDSLIKELQATHQKMLKDLQKAHKKIQDLDGQVGTLLQVVQDISDKYDGILQHIPELDESDESQDEGLMGAE
jgi:hypothetical protein